MASVSEKPICIVLGPTAVGKSQLAMELAQRFSGSIINADSMQIYRHLDIGTAKPTAAQRQQVPHLLFDVAEPSEVVSAAEFVRLADAAIASTQAEERLPIVVGGTGFYLRALTQGLCDTGPVNQEIRLKINELERQKGLTFLYERLKQVDEEAHDRLEPRDSARIKRALEVFETTGVPLTEWQRNYRPDEPRYNSVKIGLRMDRAELYERINLRSRRMFEQGIVDEVVHFEPGQERGLGYSQARSLLAGEIDLEQAVTQLAQENPSLCQTANDMVS